MTTTESTSPLLPAYLLVGADSLKRKTAFERLYARLEQAGDIEFNFDQFDGSTAEGADIISACTTLPFASDTRLVYITQADKLARASSDLIIDYLAAPAGHTVLCLSAEKLAKNTRLYKAVASCGKQAIVDCAPLKARDLLNALRAQAMNHGITIHHDAIRALIELVGEDTMALDNELKKLAVAHHGSDAITEAEVRSLVSHTAEVRIWTFVDAFSDKDLKKCLWCLERMPNTSPHAIIASCTLRVRELIITSALMRRGSSAELARALKAPDWKVRYYTSWAKKYSPARLRAILKKTRDTEKAMKSGTDPQEALLDWLLYACR